jgi:hypothetical protein
MHEDKVDPEEIIPVGLIRREPETGDIDWERAAPLLFLFVTCLVSFVGGGLFGAVFTWYWCR